MGFLLWVMEFLPDSLFVFIAYVFWGAGITLYIVSKLVKWIPMISTYKLPAELVGILLAVFAAYLFGSHSTQMLWEGRVKEMEEKVAAAEAKSKEVNTVVKTKIVYKTKVVKETQIQYVDRIKEVAVQIDKKCEVDPAVIDILNKAAEDPTKGDKK